jgi:hypothetical protein
MSCLIDLSGSQPGSDGARTHDWDPFAACLRPPAYPAQRLPEVEGRIRSDDPQTGPPGRGNPGGPR